MTTTTLAAAILRDVPRHSGCEVIRPVTVIYEHEVLAALTAALDPAIAEQAGEVLEGVTPGPWVYEYTGIGHTVRQPGAYNAIFTVNHAGNFEQDARFIAWCRESVPALLAQIAALRAERDTVLGMYMRSSDEGFRQKARADAAEAEVEKLRGALNKLHHAVCGETGFAACVRLDSGKAYPWPALDDADETARAALTTEADNG